MTRDIGPGLGPTRESIQTRPVGSEGAGLMEDRLGVAGAGRPYVLLPQSTRRLRLKTLASAPTAKRAQAHIGPAATPGRSVDCPTKLRIICIIRNICPGGTNTWTANGFPPASTGHPPR